MEIVSRIGKVQATDERVYALLSDFNNLSSFVPPENVENFQSDTDSCSFTVKNMGNFSMRVIEREPFTLIKIGSGDGMMFKFNLWIQLKKADACDTRVKVTLRSEMNAMLQMMAKKPLTKFVESLVDRIEMIR